VVDVRGRVVNGLAEPGQQPQEQGVAGFYVKEIGKA